jgi:WD40 repeat protein
MDYEYRVGGSLGYDHPTYIDRQADQDLLQSLKQGNFCYVFNSRQMGKSSLRVRVMHQLQDEKNHCLSVDITSLGSDGNINQWYNGIITQLFLSLNLSTKVNLKAWFKEKEDVSAVQKLGKFIEEVLLDKFSEDNFYIFLDEIDKTLSLPFSVDDLFSLIRFCYNQRAEVSKYKRLTFALFGVATPSALIREKTQTSFNIGQPIELFGFTLAETKPLEIGLESIAQNPHNLMQEILTWTEGQPFLTQKLCQLILKHTDFIANNQEVEAVKAIVLDYIIKNWESQDEPVHLKTIRERLLYHKDRAGRLLGIYQAILQQGHLESDNSPEQVELILSGLVVKRDGILKPYNPIYQQVFDNEWIKKELEKLRPYSESLLAWEVSKYQDESRLLRGNALEEALMWSRGKSLTNLDYQFLTASQSLDKREVLASQQILLKANQKAQKRIRLGSIFLIASGIVAASAIGWARYALNQQYISQKSIELQGQSESAKQQFQINQGEGLINAMQSMQTLQNLSQGDLLQDYSTTKPLLILDQLLDKVILKNDLEAHEQGINSVSISPDSKKIATASEDGTAKIWTISGQLILTLNGHQGAIYGISFSPDNNLIATASGDKTVKLWTLDGKEKIILKGHTAAVYNVVFSPDGKLVATTSQDKTVRIWDVSGHLITVLRGHTKSVDDVSFSLDQKQLVTASRDGSVRLWEITGKELKHLTDFQASFYSVSFSPDGQWIAAAGRDQLVWLWSKNGQLEGKFKGHKDGINSISFSPDSRHLATAANDGTAKLWNLKGEIINTLMGYQKPVLDVAFSPNSQRLVTVSAQGRMMIWDLYKTLAKSARRSINPLPSAISRVSFSGNYGAIATQDRFIYLINAQGQIISRFPSNSRWIDSLSLSENLLAATDNDLTLWDKQGNIQANLTDDYPFSASLVTPDSQSLWTGNRQGIVKKWNLQTNHPKLQETLAAHPDQRIIYLAITLDQKLLATTSEQGEINLYDLQTLTPIYSLEKSSSPVNGLIFSPDSQQLAIAFGDGMVKLVNIAQKLPIVLKKDAVPVTSLNFSLEGQFLLTGSENGTVRLWDRQGQLKWEFQDYTKAIAGLALQKNPPEILVIYQDGRIDYRPFKEEIRSSQLLEQGCFWLKDYLDTHPTQKICR